MLVLSRKPGEKIILDSGIVVEVLEVRGRRVRLGISAPPDVLIERAELRRIDPAAPEVNQAAGRELVVAGHIDATGGHR